MQKKTVHSESGNMLIYILGAILLIGILIVATKGNYQPGASIDGEKVTLQALQVRRYASEIERGLNFAMQNGLVESDIRFAHSKALPAYGTYGTNPKAEIFHPEGGGVEWRDQPANIQTLSAPWVFTGMSHVLNVGTSCAQATCSELLAILPNVSKAFCIQMNNAVGIENPSGNPPVELNSFNYATPFAGTFTYSTVLDTTGNYTSGRTEGCFEGKGGDAVAGRYYYYKVLLVR